MILSLLFMKVCAMPGATLPKDVSNKEQWVYQEELKLPSKSRESKRSVNKRYRKYYASQELDKSPKQERYYQSMRDLMQDMILSDYVSTKYIRSLDENKRDDQSDPIIQFLKNELIKNNIFAHSVKNTLDEVLNDEKYQEVVASGVMPYNALDTEGWRATLPRRSISIEQMKKILVERTVRRTQNNSREFIASPNSFFVGGEASHLQFRYVRILEVYKLLLMRACLQKYNDKFKPFKEEEYRDLSQVAPDIYQVFVKALLELGYNKRIDTKKFSRSAWNPTWEDRQNFTLPYIFQKSMLKVGSNEIVKKVDGIRKVLSKIYSDPEMQQILYQHYLSIKASVK